MSQSAADRSTARTLVVGVGEHRPSPDLLEYVAARAVAGDHPVRLVHAVRSALTDPAVAMVGEAEMRRIAQGQVDDAVERLRAVDDRVDVTGEVRTGPPVDALLDAARDAAGIVLQRSRSGWLHRIATGAITGTVAARSDVSTTCVPAEWVAVPRTAPEIAAAVRELPDDGFVLDRAFAEAAERGTSLRVLHAWHVPSYYDDIVLERTAREKWSAEQRERLEAALAPWREGHQGVDVAVEVDHLRTADALVRASEHCDLLVLGRHARPVLGHHLDALQRAVLRESRCPVLVVPEPER